MKRSSALLQGREARDAREESTRRRKPEGGTGRRGWSVEGRACTLLSFMQKPQGRDPSVAIEVLSVARPRDGHR